MYRLECHNDMGILARRIELAQLGVSFLARSCWRHSSHRVGRGMSSNPMGAAQGWCMRCAADPEASSLQWPLDRGSCLRDRE